MVVYWDIWDIFLWEFYLFNGELSLDKEIEDSLTIYIFFYLSDVFFELTSDNEVIGLYKSYISTSLTLEGIIFLASIYSRAIIVYALFYRIKKYFDN